MRVRDRSRDSQERMSGVRQVMLPARIEMQQECGSIAIVLARFLINEEVSIMVPSMVLLVKVSVGIN